MTLKGSHPLNADPAAQVNWCSHAEAQEKGVPCRRGVRMQIHGVSKGTSTLMLVDSDHLRYGGSDSNWRTPADALWELQTLRAHSLVYPGFLTWLDGMGSEWSEPPRRHWHQSHQAGGQKHCFIPSWRHFRNKHKKITRQHLPLLSPYS